MAPPSQLAELQQRMLEAIASSRPGASSGTGLGLLPSLLQSADDRLGIYQHAYWARLLECMRELFPVLSATLGHAAFDSLSAGYLERYPPTSYSLNHLADGFANFLCETRPAASSSPDWPGFVVELARLEHTINEVFDGPGSEDLPSLRLSEAGLRPASFRLVAAPCLRVVTFDFPVNEFYTAVRHGESPAWPAAATSYLAITRCDYVVRRVPLEEAEYLILQGLLEGRALAESLSAAGREIAPSEARQWFAAWGRLGFFVDCQQ